MGYLSLGLSLATFGLVALATPLAGLGWWCVTVGAILCVTQAAIGPPRRARPRPR